MKRTVHHTWTAWTVNGLRDFQLTEYGRGNYYIEVGLLPDQMQRLSRISKAVSWLLQDLKRIPKDPGYIPHDTQFNRTPNSKELK